MHWPVPSAHSRSCVTSWICNALVSAKVQGAGGLAACCRDGKLSTATGQETFLSSRPRLEHVNRRKGPSIPVYPG